MSKPKTTLKQRREIVRRYVYEGDTVTELAQEYGLSRSRVYDILRKDYSAENMKNLLEAQKAAAMMRLYAQAEKAVTRNGEILDQDYDPQYQYLHQNAIRDTLDRTGIRAPKEEKQNITITFSNGDFEIGMPERESNEEWPESEA